MHESDLPSYPRLSLAIAWGITTVLVLSNAVLLAALIYGRCP